MEVCFGSNGMKVVKDGIGFEAGASVVVELEMIDVDGGKDLFRVTGISVAVVLEIIEIFTTGTEIEVVMVDDGTKIDVCVMEVGIGENASISLERDDEIGT